MGGGVRETRGRDMCLHMADSLCYTAEAHTILYSNYCPQLKFKTRLQHTHTHKQRYLLVVLLENISQTWLQSIFISLQS